MIALCRGMIKELATKRYGVVNGDDLFMHYWGNILSWDLYLAGTTIKAKLNNAKSHFYIATIISQNLIIT